MKFFFGRFIGWVPSSADVWPEFYTNSFSARTAIATCVKVPSMEVNYDLT